MVKQDANPWSKHATLPYVDKLLSKLRWHTWMLKTTRVLLNVATFTASFLLVIVSTLLLSKLVWNYYPLWYYYFSVGVSAFTFLVASVLNFFMVKKRLRRTMTKYNLIKTERFLFTLKLGCYAQANTPAKKTLYHRTWAIIHNDPSGNTVNE